MTTRDASRERARADSLAIVARAAEGRAADAAARAYDAVRNLQRVVASVTDVRETDVG
jgi:hypothetical protein